MIERVSWLLVMLVMLGLVLLRNTGGLLPLAKGNKLRIALIGPHGRTRKSLCGTYVQLCQRAFVARPHAKVALRDAHNIPVALPCLCSW